MKHRKKSVGLLLHFHSAFCIFFLLKVGHLPSCDHGAQRREAVARTRAAAPIWRAVADFFFWSLAIWAFFQTIALLAAVLEYLF